MKPTDIDVEATAKALKGQIFEGFVYDEVMGPVKYTGVPSMPCPPGVEELQWAVMDDEARMRWHIRTAVERAAGSFLVHDSGVEVVSLGNSRFEVNADLVLPAPVDMITFEIKAQPKQQEPEENTP